MITIFFFLIIERYTMKKVSHLVTIFPSGCGFEVCRGESVEGKGFSTPGFAFCVSPRGASLGWRCPFPHSWRLRFFSGCPYYLL